MATGILTIVQLPRNDVLRLAQLFATAFRHFCEFKTSLSQDYRKELDAILRLGLAATLVEKGFIAKYYPRLKPYLQYCDLANDKQAISILHKSLAEMIKLGMYLCRSRSSFQVTVGFAINGKSSQGESRAAFLSERVEDMHSYLKIIWQEEFFGLEPQAQASTNFFDLSISAGLQKEILSCK